MMSVYKIDSVSSYHVPCPISTPSVSSFSIPLHPEGHYFFLGDNRNNSNDSRFWKQKYVPAANLKAKARLIAFPFTRIGWL